jgi:hypothetical protein
MKIDSLDKARLLSKPAGYLKLAMFCEQVEAGETPDIDLLRDIADSFQAFLNAPSTKERLPAFAAAMNLKGRRGIRPTEAESAYQFDAAVKVLIHERAGMGPAEAVGLVADDIGRDESRVYEFLRAHRENASFVVRFLESK